MTLAFAPPARSCWSAWRPYRVVFGAVDAWFSFRCPRCFPLPDAVGKLSKLLVFFVCCVRVFSSLLADCFYPLPSLLSLLLLLLLAFVVPPG